MVTKIAAVDSVKCFIVLTNTAREAIKQHFQDEHAFFNLQNLYEVYLEKQSIEQTSISLTIFFDNKRNKKLAQKFDERVVIMDCVFDLKNGLVAKSFRTKGKHTPVETNRRKRIRINFVPSRISGHTYSDIFIKTIAELPVAQERFDYVNKRISSWEGYLKVLNKNAAIEDIDGTFSTVQYNSDRTVLSLHCSGIDDKQWKQLKGLSAYVKGFKREIGEVVKIHRPSHTVEIELTPKIAIQARHNEFELTSEYITFSNASTKSQLQRLLKGFERLKEGLAANANLENILFEDKPLIAERKNDLEIEFHNNLNEYQREAVMGAMSAEDLYVIQGPPGTGKTTVISEICYQNVKAGLRTLIASQSNLAVDNALSRLLSDKDIRILRYGRTESIEEDGKKFIEENVSEYWKKQTYEAITDEINQHETKEQQLREEIQLCKDNIKELNEKEIVLKQDIIKKQEAQTKLSKITEDITNLKKQLGPLKKEQEKTEQTLEKLRSSYSNISTKKQDLEQIISSIGTPEEINKEIEETKRKVSETHRLIQYAQLKDKLQQAEKQLEDVGNKLAQFEIQHTQTQSVQDEIQSIKKIFDIEQYIEANRVRRGYVLNQLFVDIEKIHQDILKLKPVKDLSNRIEKAVDYSNKTLGIQLQNIHFPQNQHYSLQEIDEFLTRLSHAFASKRITKENGVRSIEGLYIRRLYVNNLLQQYQALIDESILVFNKIKEEVTEQMLQKMGTNQSQLSLLKEKQIQINQLVEQYNRDLEEFEIEDSLGMISTSELQTTIDLLNQQIHSLQKNREKITETEQLLTQKQQESDSLQKEILNGEDVLQNIVEEIKQVNSTGISLEKEADLLVQITKQNPELELEKTEQQIDHQEKQIAKLQQKIELLPVAQSLQSEWKELLNQATEHDLDEIRKLYVKHANVIGTTCVASANKEFMDNYPTFDVVIIDEVSKATPPELLLPMLKGKKIVLVGDHHQLPPLIGDDTFEETLETVLKESDTFEEKRELEKLLEESLFERLYKNLPKTNKKMLAIQYRMHENIMQTIAPFYKSENESLQCGLTDSDTIRDHKLESKFINRHDHLIWYDIPNEPSFFEKRMKEGSSLFNESELEVISNMLIDLNEATGKAKAQGLIPQDSLKSVGVISFYAEQVKRINRLIEQEIDLPHLHIRTGSVDKFQGMEMDVILVSMVRNNDNKHGDIGFAKDYRRLNVALSRARELLILIGSTEMFTKRPKKEETRNMYNNLLNIVKKQEGYRKAIV